MKTISDVRSISIMDAPHATEKPTAKDLNKENTSAQQGEPKTPPRKAPARDKLKPLAMPKALKI